MDKNHIVENKDKVKEYDVFKDSIVRYCGYTNEVGESFRGQIPVGLVRLSYVAASVYVLCDAIHKGHQAWKCPERSPDNKSLRRCRKTGTAFADTLIWQGFASIAIPGFTINRICWLTRLGLRQIPYLPQHVGRWAVVAAGLMCIPFIIKPIDSSVDVAMDRTVRRLYLHEDDV